MRLVLDYLGMTIGGLMIALGLILFTIPNRIAAGGVSGLATIIYYLTHFPVGITMLLLNVPLFAVGLRRLGWQFGLKSLCGTVILSLFIDLLDPYLGVPTRDPLLASVYGGILSGVGLGMVFRVGGTTGGTDLAAQIMRQTWRVSSGRMLMFVDGAVIALAGMVFNVELALYALLSLFISSQVIDVVQEGVGYVKAALIISEQNQEIAQGILYHLNRGATVLKGKGAYTGTDREVLLCVVTRAELSKLKGLVADLDPRAFVIVSNVHEVLGEGFKEVGGR